MQMAREMVDGGFGRADTRARRWLPGAVLLFSLLFAVHDEVRPRGLDAPFHEFMGSRDQIQRNLQTFEVWRNRSEVPERSSPATIPELAPPVYRILTPAVVYAASRLPQPRSWLSGVRVALVAGFLMLVFLLSRRWLCDVGAAVVVALTAAMTYEVPIPAIETAIHAVLMTGALLLLVSGRSGPLLAVYTLAALNREDALLIPLTAGVAWLFGRGRQGRGLVWTALACVGISVCVRAVGIAVIGHRPYYTDVVQIGHNLEALGYLISIRDILHPDLNVVLPLLVMALMSLLWYRSKPPMLQAGPVVFWLYLTSVLIIGRFHEANKYPPLMAFVVPGAVWSLLPSLRRNGPSQGGGATEDPEREGNGG